MTIHASDEPRAWDAYAFHLQTCLHCGHERPMYPLCPVGKALYLQWSLTDAVAQRAEQEADVADCADDLMPPAWVDDHQDDYRGREL